MSTHHASSQADAVSHKEADMQRRRLESEMLMYRADRLKLVRRKDEIDVELRTLKRDLDQKKLELDQRQEESHKIIADIQSMDTELLRLRKRFNSL